MPDKSAQRISFTCPECKAHLKVPAKLAGVTGPCPKCHASITAPVNSTTEEETPPETESPAEEPTTTKAEEQPSTAVVETSSSDASSITDKSDTEADDLDAAENTTEIEETPETERPPAFNILPAPVYNVNPSPSFPPLADPEPTADKTEHNIEPKLSQTTDTSESESELEVELDQIFQPFFLPGQVAPVLDHAVHAPPVYPGSSPVLPPTTENNLPLEEPTEIASASSAAYSGPQLLPTETSTSSLDSEAAPTTRLSTTTEKDKSAPKFQLPPIPNQALPKSTETEADDQQNPKAGFARLIKSLIIFTLIVFAAIGSLIGDYYLGGIGILHKLPGFTPASSFVSAVLTPPNLQTSESDKTEEQKTPATAPLNPQLDTMAQADLEPVVENENTVIDSIDTPSMPTVDITAPAMAEPLNDKKIVIADQGESMVGVKPALPEAATLAGTTAAESVRPSEATQLPEMQKSTDPLAETTAAIVIKDDNNVAPLKMDSSLPGLPSITTDAPLTPAAAKTTPPEPAAIKASPIMARAVAVELPKTNASEIAEKASASKPQGHAASTSSPSSPEAGKLLTEPRQITEAFLKASSWQARLPYIYNGEALKKTITEYYQQDPQAAISDYNLEFINMERSHTDNTLFYVFFLVTKELPDGFPIILRSEKGQLKVDWEIFAEFNDQHFKYFIKGEDRGPHPLRIMLKRASYWGPDKDKFTDLNDYLCFGISAPPFPEEGEFVFIKKDNPLAAQLEQSLPWGQRPISGIVALEKVKFPHGEDHLMIKSIVTDGWFSPVTTP